MSIINTLNKWEVMKELGADDSAKWSYDQAEALYEWYEDLYDDTTWELDTIEIKGVWTAYDTIAEALADYSVDSWKDLQEQTQTIEGLDDGTVLVHEF
jgi:phage-related tail protein